jgi:hypothetical protein
MIYRKCLNKIIIKDLIFKEYEKGVSVYFRDHCMYTIPIFNMACLDVFKTCLLESLCSYEKLKYTQYTSMVAMIYENIISILREEKIIEILY